MKTPIIDSNSSYSFADYFKLSSYIEEILNEFGYSLERCEYQLPQSRQQLDRLQDLKDRLRENLPLLNLNNETVRREFLIAPVLMDLAHYVRPKIRVEFPLMLNEQLKGNLDYYLEAQGQVLIIEAKNADLESGFAQLAVELIALDKWCETIEPCLYGAVSTGNIWQFAILHRKEQGITQDLNLFRVPADLEELLRILIAILSQHHLEGAGDGKIVADLMRDQD
ncbi:MAG: hypothetical protein HC877_17860 [Thioploca sp.]|nr:hypothetical protein [Thioploca sp.]